MSNTEIVLDAYVLPDGHRVFKLFPGKTYRLNKEIVSSRCAFLDIQGLDAMSGRPSEWADADLRRIVSQDRLLRTLEAKKPSKRPGSQDTKRIGFLKNLLLVAKKGDLVVVPLGKGLDGEVAIGEFETDPGDVRKVNVTDGTHEYVTWGRPVNWRTTIKRRRFSPSLNDSLHAPTAFHLLEETAREEIYLAAYGSFTYDDIYVAYFPSSKERLTTTDQATIGIWFNGLAVIHQHGLDKRPIPPGENFFDLGLEEGGVDLELVRNSPWSAVMRTVGPLAFSVLALYPMAVQGATLADLHHVTITAKAVAGATDQCNVIVPPDLAQIAKGLGEGRWDDTCRLGKRVEKGATLRPTARLKPGHKEPKSSK